MGSSLTIDDAIKKIEDIAITFTTDFKLIVAKRKTNTRLDKKIIFALTIKKEDSKDENLFNALNRLLLTEENFLSIESNYFMDNNTLKEDYFITTLIGSL